MAEEKLVNLEKKLNYSFENSELLQTALTHKTYAFESSTPINYNERLELLGDSILNFLIAEQLYTSNKYFSEGELTRRRAIVVNNVYLAERAKEIGLGKFLLLGKGETKQNGKKNPTNLANALEALIGAIYLDSDLENVREFVLNKIFTDDVL